eukprot:403347748
MKIEYTKPLRDSTNSKHINEVGQQTFNEDEFLTSIPDEICFEDDTAQKQYSELDQQILIKEHQPTKVTFKDDVENNWNMTKFQIIDEPSSIKPANQGISPGVMTQRMKQAQPINLMQLFNKAEGHQVILKENQVSQNGINDKNSKNNIIVNKGQIIHGHRSNNRQQKIVDRDQINVKFVIDPKSVPQEKLNNKSPHINRNELSQSQIFSKQELQNKSQNNLNKSQSHVHLSQTWKNLNLQKQLNQSTAISSQNPNQFTTSKTTKKSRNNISFSNISRERIDIVKNKQHQVDQQLAQETPLELKLIKFNQTVIGLDSNSMNKTPQNLSQQNDNSVSISRINGHTRQRSKSRNIVERYLKNSNSKTQISTAKAYIQFRKDIAQLKIDSNQQDQTQTLDNNNLQLHLKLTSESSTNLQQNNLYDIDLSENDDDVSQRDFDENRALMISPKCQYSPEKYPRDMRRSPSKNKFDSQSNQTQKTSRASIVVFDVRDKNKQITNANNSINMMQIYKRDKSRAKKQSHSDYINFQSSMT